MNELLSEINAWLHVYHWYITGIVSLVSFTYVFFRQRKFYLIRKRKRNGSART